MGDACPGRRGEVREKEKREGRGRRGGGEPEAKWERREEDRDGEGRKEIWGLPD